MVVNQREFIQRPLQCHSARNGELPKQRLERAEQAFDPPVLPRAVKLGALVINARQWWLAHGLESSLSNCG